MSPKPTQAAIMTQLQEAVGHHQAGRLDQACAIYDRVLETDPEQPDALHLRGLVASQTEDYEKAADLIGKAAAIQPNNPAYHGNLGVALRHLGRREEAIAAYRKALEIEPRFVEAHANLGILSWELGNREQAEAHMRDALAIKPDYGLALFALGSALMDRGDLAEAEKLMVEAARRDPAYPFGAICRWSSAYAQMTADQTYDALIGELPPVEGSFPEGGTISDGAVLFTACDPVYARDYALPLLRSVAANAPGMPAHLHIFNPDSALSQSIDAVRAAHPDLALTVTGEAADGADKRYFSNIRFVRLCQAMEQCGRPFLALDTDSLVLADPNGALAALPGDVAILLRPENMHHHMKVLASAVSVQPTDAGQQFVRRLATFILACWKGGMLPWYLDQVAMYGIYRLTRLADEPLEMTDMPAAIVDHDLSPDASIWTAKGDKKAGGAFWDLKARFETD